MHTCVHMLKTYHLGWRFSIIQYTLHLSYFYLTLDVRVQLETKFMFANLLCSYASPRFHTLKSADAKVLKCSHFDPLYKMTSKLDWLKAPQEANRAVWTLELRT